MNGVAWALIVGAYLLGAVPFGLLLGRLAGVDVRSAGSGNIGATNVARSAGRWLGLVTLLLDGLKGAVAPLAAGWLVDDSVTVQALAGGAAVVGHVFPVYLRFRGGKGVATATGVFLALTPMAALVAIGTFAAVYGVTRVVSIGSLVASLVLVGATWWLDGRLPFVILAGAVVLLIFIRHTPNLRRMWRGRELGL